MEFKIFDHNQSRDFDDYVLGGDVGGTNTSLGVAGVKDNKTTLLFSFSYETKKLPNLDTAIKHALDCSKTNYNIEVKKACIAVAGMIKDNLLAITQNIKWDVDSKKILRNTKLSKIKLINDFEALGYGINLLEKKDTTIINKGIPNQGKVKAIIGAGTGLGKAILYSNETYYFPLPSEGGHEDFPAQNEEELELVNHVKKMLKTDKPITYEMFLSGPGLERIYDYVKTKQKPTKVCEEIDKSEEKSALISKYRKKDNICKKTFQLLKRIYAKAAKNFALTTLCLNGLYIAGGIAIKNIDIFDREFLDEFQKHYLFQDVLKKIPIYVIKNYDISLYGSVLYASLKL